MKLLKRGAVKFFNAFGYSINKNHSYYHNMAVELSDEEVDLVKYVLNSRFTMASVPRLVNTLKACKYVVDNNISGDFVECGVWRGGNGILAKKVFDLLGSDKKVWMFDTFEGMTEPTDLDVNATSQVKAEIKYRKTLVDTHSKWCFASLEDVKRNCIQSKIEINDVRFVQGDVGKTLKDSSNFPDAISVLRLDTDWYESTKTELEVLYPRLTSKGVLIIDDYGHWEGARKAVDEYFELQDYKPLFSVTDYTGRSAVKH